MNVGDRVRITPKAWERYLKERGARPGEKFNPGVQEVTEAHPREEVYRLSFPYGYWWKPEDLIAVPVVEPVVLESNDCQSVTRAFCAVMEMWGRRYDYDLDKVDESQIHYEGEPFPGPVVVDLGQLAVAQSELLRVIQKTNPELYQNLFAPGGTPDAPLPPDPSTVPGEEMVTNLDEVRIRLGVDLRTEAIAYVEAVWGKDTYGFNAAIRDLEAMRRGKDDGTLRRPETYHEGMLLVHHVRALANDLARNFGMDHLVRDEDDLGSPEPPKPGERGEEQ
jgi:hypothetical protein